MFKHYRQLVAEARASYSKEKAEDEKRSELFAFWFYRPLSFYLTPLFLATGWTADGVTVLQFVMAVLIPVVALVGGFSGAALVVGLALLMQVLDCVDGNMARVTRRYSAAGSLLDGLCTLLFWSLYFFALGILAQGSASGWVASHGRELGLALAALMLAQREMEDSFDNCFEERVRWTPPAVEKSERFSWVGKVAEQSFAFGGLLIAAALGGLDWFLVLVAAYQITLLLIWLPRFCRAVYTKMQQPRK